eukprot:comp7612_c0_seq1/m.7801 comp7612_c0_seq1/g.7801  ORF comp7612_c0_seq1/g.7801 comp7612_c0_seq1/m.7801 type:complete len:165 (-) comp7612_c0_seq1:107-601(-)
MEIESAIFEKICKFAFRFENIPFCGFFDAKSAYGIGHGNVISSLLIDFSREILNDREIIGIYYVNEDPSNNTLPEYIKELAKLIAKTNSSNSCKILVPSPGFNINRDFGKNEVMSYRSYPENMSAQKVVIKEQEKIAKKLTDMKPGQVWDFEDFMDNPNHNWLE